MPFRYIPIDFPTFIFIALADDTPQPLLKIEGRQDSVIGGSERCASTAFHLFPAFHTVHASFLHTAFHHYKRIIRIVNFKAKKPY